MAASESPVQVSGRGRVARVFNSSSKRLTLQVALLLVITQRAVSPHGFIMDKCYEKSLVAAGVIVAGRGMDRRRTVPPVNSWKAGSPMWCSRQTPSCAATRRSQVWAEYQDYQRGLFSAAICSWW